MNKINYLVMDVDGTLTDGKIYMGNDGEMMKAFNIKDGCGIHDILLPAQIVPVIITGRRSRILENRCKEIGIDSLFQGISNKVEQLKLFLSNVGSGLSKVAYIGDDINDLACMKEVKNAGGVIGCPNDAADSVKSIANYISVKNGGEGAVRDFIEHIVYHSEYDE